jgi:cellulose synthase/poly-beta-1,6-N-acetylglucosamine synthase-like glycosyltransferase
MTQNVQHKAVPRYTSQLLFSKGQIVFSVLVLLATASGIVFAPHATALVIVALVLLFYVLFVGQKVLLGSISLSYTPPAAPLVTVDDPDLPTYTIYIPLYKEANMLPKLVESINGLHYPKDRLQVILLLEEIDMETRAEAAVMDLDPWFETLVAPKIYIEGTNILFKGKPKALNLGLANTRGTFSVIYDAEDRPDPDQLLKAVAAFRAAPENVACVQARLYFWNKDSSWVTRFYWTEYVIHFEWVLPGLAKLGLIPPLGGTSNHFRTEVLRKIAITPDKLPKGGEGIGGWDPYNVTEDAELAGALALNGYRVIMIDSTTNEEATATLRIADPQRRRWLKGYLQTGLAYTRQPIRTARQMGVVKWFSYILLMLGTPISLLLNPIMWGLTITYFVTRSPLIESWFPAPLFYTGMLLTVAGNLLLFYQLVVACLHREGYGTVKYLLLTPVWWAFTSWSAYRVLWELARPSTRHAWNKTPHGHDIHKEAIQETEPTRMTANLDVV